MLKNTIVENFHQEIEKKVDFFDYVKELHLQASEYYQKLPRNQWIKFSDIPYHIFFIVFDIIDRGSNITVDIDYKEFMIMNNMLLNKKEFPDSL